jgi:hypothetical protein
MVVYKRFPYKSLRTGRCDANVQYVVVYKRFPYKSLRTGGCDANVQYVAWVLQSVILLASCDTCVILLSLYLVIVVYKRFPYKSLRMAAVMLMSSV